MDTPDLLIPLVLCVQTLVSYYEDLALYQNLTVLYENLANGVMEA